MLWLTYIACSCCKFEIKPVTQTQTWCSVKLRALAGERNIIAVVQKRGCQGNEKGGKFVFQR